METFKKNPFEIFGLTPKIVKELDEENLFRLIKAIYRVFQMIHHPDKGGDSKKALEINLAFESLNLEKNSESFRNLRKKYIERLSRKTVQKEIEELKTQNRKIQFYNELLKERFWQFIENQYEFLQKLIDQEKALKLKIFDMVSYMNLSHLRKVKKQLFFKEILLFQKFILKRKSYEKFFRNIINYKYIGSIKREYIEPWVLLERDLREGFQEFKNFLSKETFIKECLVYLEPDIKPNSYIFFYYPEDFERVFLEGIVIGQEILDKEEILEILKNRVIKPEKRIEKENFEFINNEIIEY